MEINKDQWTTFTLEELPELKNRIAKLKEEWLRIVHMQQYLIAIGKQSCCYDDMLWSCAGLLTDKSLEFEYQQAENGNIHPLEFTYNITQHKIHNEWQDRYQSLRLDYEKAKKEDKTLFRIKDDYLDGELIVYAEKLTEKYNELKDKLNYLKKLDIDVSQYQPTLELIGTLLSENRITSGLNELLAGNQNSLINDLGSAYKYIQKDLVHSINCSLLEETYNKFNSSGIPLAEYDNIKEEYAITIKELKSLHNKMQSIVVASKNIKLLKKLVSEFLEEYTSEPIEKNDYPLMLNATSVIQNLLRIYQKDITLINSLSSHKKVVDMYIKEKETGDGHDIYDQYHTMSELYFNRLIMFDIICKLFPEKSWKSKLHDDGTMFKDYFIVGVNTSEGQFTYHYHIRFWDIFTCKEIPKAPKYDGHQPKDISRLYSLLIKEESNER